MLELRDGLPVRVLDGTLEGDGEGTSVGFGVVGSSEGLIVGRNVGSWDGNDVGFGDGLSDGVSVGFLDG